ncbi:hypothetical protein BDW75DRAFT_171500 [Aspergillus navahoensis]
MADSSYAGVLTFAAIQGRCLQDPCGLLIVHASRFQTLEIRSWASYRTVQSCIINRRSLRRTYGGSLQGLTPANRDAISKRSSFHDTVLGKSSDIWTSGRLDGDPQPSPVISRTGAAA